MQTDLYHKGTMLLVWFEYESGRNRCHSISDLCPL